MGGAEGQATDIEIQAKEILRLKKLMNEILAENTGQKFDKVQADTERDFWMNPEEAKNYGLVDKVLK
jgi:ATP-dependent Clp protease, protease subunit